MITCVFEDNGTGALRHVTVNAIVVRDGKILLSKRGTYNGGKQLSEAGKWALLGGFLSRDETIEEGLRREIQEESGWEVDTLELLHIKDNPNRPAEDRQNIEFVYIATAKNKIAGNDEEVTRLQWFSLDNLPLKEECAFDHAEDLKLYVAFLKQKFPLPIIGKYQE